ncbi:hypothetical protein MmiHf6_03200 [Methanimicrococcus hongohii]|uniref:DUF523 domain-containing protein n=1 Tax=Methanimicrococcus hongohii TaxID=3028295 RepID=A0AA96UYN9_9EURY|nr:hypothetical protein [Methanimicrococcus sp. Hf6]WNY23024.1 hypothetical protein MmiHf6_03200 [Methanimicrococcus sp. Hf6]
MTNQMKGEIFVIAHCLLNPLARVKGIRQPEPFETKNKRIIQLPCPELIYAGPDRGKKAKEDYDTVDYRCFCQQLFLPYADMIEMFSKEGYLISITGVPKSPSCGVFTTSILPQEIRLSSENQVAEG